MIRESIPSLPWTFRLRNTLPDETHPVRQGVLNIWICANQFVCELVIGEKSMDGRITTPGATLLTNGYAYRNTSAPQGIADDIYECNQGDETVALLNPNIAASVLGKLGGSSTSKRKAQASRANGKKGGRPHKPADR
jgi:hypothetical protein